MEGGQPARYLTSEMIASQNDDLAVRLAIAGGLIARPRLPIVLSLYYAMG